MQNIFKDGISRCNWVKDHTLYIKYHDFEWGVPEYNDSKLFELLVLESAEAGLNWLLILKKRDNYRKAYHNFVPSIVAKYDEKKQKALLSDDGIIRSKSKIAASIINAQALLRIQEDFNSFSNYIWGFVGHKPILNTWHTTSEVPDETPLSKKITTDMKKRGFKFVGPRIIYAFMQAIGMVNDHPTYCFKSHLSKSEGK